MEAIGFGFDMRDFACETKPNRCHLVVLSMAKPDGFFSKGVTRHHIVCVSQRFHDMCQIDIKSPTMSMSYRGESQILRQ